MTFRIGDRLLSHAIERRFDRRLQVVEIAGPDELDPQATCGVHRRKVGDVVHAPGREQLRRRAVRLAQRADHGAHLGERA